MRLFGAAPAGTSVAPQASAGRPHCTQIPERNSTSTSAYWLLRTQLAQKPFLSQQSARELTQSDEKRPSKFSRGKGRSHALHKVEECIHLILSIRIVGRGLTRILVTGGAWRIVVAVAADRLEHNAHWSRRLVAIITY